MLYNDLEDGYVQTSLGKIHYKQHEGKGAKVIFLHGVGASTKAFAKLTVQLPDSLGVYLVDLLGHGDSDAPEIEYRIGVQAQAVKEFMGKKGIEDGYLFGHSYGAWIAASAAQGNYKGRGIILEDSPGLKDYFDDIKKKGEEEKHRDDVFKEAILTNPREQVMRSIIYSRSSDDYLTRESLSRIVKPSLIIWGSNDDTVDVSYARLFNEYIKGSVLEIVQGAGHVPHYSHPQAVKDLLLRFVGA